VFCPVKLVTTDEVSWWVQVTGVDVILTSRCQRQYSNGHAYHINSISCASDNATFMSADDLRINLWHLEVGAQAFNIVDIKPTNMEDLTEVGMPYLRTMSHIICVEAVSWAVGWCCAREGDCHHPISWRMVKLQLQLCCDLSVEVFTSVWFFPS
jgi:hypothetical protein